tara:strand:+ start:107 stop:478 length:372 start_codon:yes stop_codon:yes gene_type:complete
VSTWGVSLNDKQISHSSKNSVNDTIFLNKADLKPTDTLGFSYHMCGHLLDNRTSFVLVNVSNSKEYTKHTNENNSATSAQVILPYSIISSLTENTNSFDVRLCWSDPITEKTDTIVKWIFLLK